MDGFNRDGDFGQVRERVRAANSPAPLPPRDSFVAVTGNGIKAVVIGRSHASGSDPVSSSVRYDVHWVAECDRLSSNSILAAFKRSRIVASVTEPGIDGMPADTLITDETYQSGAFFFTGVNAAGDRSDYTYPVTLSNEILDSSVPPNVTHFQASESGIIHDGVSFSRVSIEYIAPNPKKSFDAMQLVAFDYPTRGAISAFSAQHYAGGPGGFVSFDVVLQAARRAGLGTVTATNGIAIVTFGGAENALIQAAPGDFLEILGVQAEIQSVDSALQVTLTAGWTGKDVVALGEYLFLGKIRLYARSWSAGGGYDPDFANLPFADVVLDAELSPPNAPSLIATPSGRIIRLAVTVPTATSIEKVILYRGTGTAVAFADCAPIHPWGSDEVNVSSTLQFPDVYFSKYEREHAQVFSYYAACVNVRGQQGAPSTRAEAACQPDDADDTSPVTPGRDVSARNLLWNAHLYCSAAVTVSSADASQDTGMGGAAPPAGFSRWNHEEDAAVTPVGFEGPPIQGWALFPSGAVGKRNSLVEFIGAWNAAAGSQRIPKGAVLCAQFKARTSGGTPDGMLGMRVGQYNGAVLQGYAGMRTRLSDDTIDETSADIEFDSTELFAEGKLYWAIFVLDPTLTTTQIKFEIYRRDATSAANVDITQPALMIASSLSAWTAELVDASITYPAPGGPTFPPGDFPVRPGGGRIIDLP